MAPTVNMPPPWQALSVALVLAAASQFDRAAAQDSFGGDVDEFGGQPLSLVVEALPPAPAPVV
eukprot:SAG22_NODE_717_length_7707_cov_3.098186_7_plen_63_part_00